ncbi:response regulator, partial [bacterium]|nr:response regulator [bacterium]
MADTHKLRILLVDTDSNYQARLFDLLSPKYEICVLNSAPEALDFFHLYTPDLVVSEVDLPGTDGISLARQMSRRPETRRIPLVFLSYKD